MFSSWTGNLTFMTGRDRAGLEPRNARSPLQLRWYLSLLAAVGFGVAAVVLFLAGRGGDSDAADAQLVMAAVSLAVTFIALADLVVVGRRRHRGDRG